MMGALFDRVRAVGAPAIHLGCSPENTNAIAFYQRLGFEDLSGGFLWGRSTDPLQRAAPMHTTAGGDRADGGTRTPIPFRAPGPKPGVSANSTTSA